MALVTDKKFKGEDCLLKVMVAYVKTMFKSNKAEMFQCL